MCPDSAQLSTGQTWRPKLLIVEQIMPEVITPELLIPVRLSLLMLIVHSGYERTLEEYRQLLGQAGLVITRVLPTNSSHSIIEVSTQRF